MASENWLKFILIVLQATLDYNKSKRIILNTINIESKKIWKYLNDQISVDEATMIYTYLVQNVSGEGKKGFLYIGVKFCWSFKKLHFVFYSKLDNKIYCNEDIRIITKILNKKQNVFFLDNTLKNIQVATQ